MSPAGRYPRRPRRSGSRRTFASASGDAGSRQQAAAMRSRPVGDPAGGRPVRTATRQRAKGCSGPHRDGQRACRCAGPCRSAGTAGRCGPGYSVRAGAQADGRTRAASPTARPSGEGKAPGCGASRPSDAAAGHGGRRELRDGVPLRLPLPPGGVETPFDGTDVGAGAVLAEVLPGTVLDGAGPGHGRSGVLGNRSAARTDGDPLLATLVRGALSLLIHPSTIAPPRPGPWTTHRRGRSADRPLRRRGASGRPPRGGRVRITARLSASRPWPGHGGRAGTPVRHGGASAGPTQGSGPAFVLGLLQPFVHMGSGQGFWHELHFAVPVLAPLVGTRGGSGGRVAEDGGLGGGRVHRGT